MSVARNKELHRLKAAGCRCIQVEEPVLHFTADQYPDDVEALRLNLECLSRELEGLEDIEIRIHTCWGNPNMQRVFDDNSLRNSLEMYLFEAKGDVWTIETKDNDFQEIGLFGPYKSDLPKRICVGAVSHRTLQADRAGDVARDIRRCLECIPPEKLVVSSDCGFGRQGCNREIAFYRASAIAQGCNIVRQELGLEPTYVPAADPALQTDVVRSLGEEWV